MRSLVTVSSSLRLPFAFKVWQCIIATDRDLGTSGNEGAHVALKFGSENVISQCAGIVRLILKMLVNSNLFSTIDPAFFHLNYDKD